MQDKKAALVRAAAAAWPDLAAVAGLTASDFRMDVMRVRSEGDAGGRVTARMTAGSQVFVLKQLVNGASDRFARIGEAHRLAGAAFVGHEHLQVPGVVGEAPEHRAILLTFCAGETAWDRLADTVATDAHAAVLNAAGRWMGVLHRGQHRAPWRFSGAGLIARLERFAETRRHVEPDRFARALDLLRDHAASLAGVTVAQAGIHGDLTLSNLMIDADDVTGLDFENVTAAPVARDLAMLLVDYVVWFGNSEDVALDALLGTAMSDAFWSGYGSQTDADVLRFFVGLRLMRLWAAVPADPNQRTLRRAHVWSGVSAAAARLLA